MFGVSSFTAVTIFSSSGALEDRHLRSENEFALALARKGCFQGATLSANPRLLRVSTLEYDVALENIVDGIQRRCNEQLILSWKLTVE
jgi:hypothetical protein